MTQQLFMQTLLHGQLSKFINGRGEIAISRPLYARYKDLQSRYGGHLESLKDMDMSKPGTIMSSVMNILDKTIKPPPPKSRTLSYEDFLPIYTRIGQIMGKAYDLGLDLKPFRNGGDVYAITDYETNILAHALTRGQYMWRDYKTITIPEFNEIRRTLPPPVQAKLPENVYLVTRVCIPYPSFEEDEDAYRQLLRDGHALIHVYPLQLLKKPQGFDPLKGDTYPKDLGWELHLPCDRPSIHITYDPPTRLLDGLGWIGAYTDSVEDTSRRILDKLTEKTTSDQPLHLFRHMRYVDWTYRPAYNVTLQNPPQDPAGAVFYGPELEILDEWQAYMDKGIPLTVLLQGRPGSGKTTLVKTALRRFHENGIRRIFSMSAQDFALLQPQGFRCLCQAYAIQILWIEDIDRVPPEDLDTCLSKIDRQEHDIPLTIFTSNNFKKLPQAFYRPDRIDYLYKVDTQPGKISDEVLEAALKRVGLTLLELSPEHVDMLRQRCRGRTPAEVLKYVRRGHVLGFDRLQSVYDLDIHMQDETE